MIRTLSLVLSCLLTLGVTAPAAEGDRPLINSEVPDLKFKDIRYLPRSLKDFGEKKAIVLVFSNTTCPIAQKYWPKLKRLEAEYRDKGVQFVGVNVSGDDELQEIAQQAIDFAIEFPMVKDIENGCVKATGVTRSPEVVVLDAKRKLRYRGRIDDQVRIGGTRPDVQSDDLKNAIEDLLAGREVATSETTVDGCKITWSEPTPLPKEPVTFYEQVAPLLQKHCQECHHSGGQAPFGLVSLEEVSSHAEMIAEVVGDRRMPPWYASRQHKFANERGMSTGEREAIAHWVRGGSKTGDVGKAPPPLKFNDTKWEIGEPDLITTSLETHSLPADGFVDYKYIVLPHIFLKDTWISMAEILPSNPRVVHHCNMAYWTIGQNFNDGNFITGRVPGGTAFRLDDGVALCIPAGSVVGLQIHYTTTGKPETNGMQVGFRFPREIVHKQVRHIQATTSRFAIPPGASAHPVFASRTLPVNASGIGMFSHMHLRGKDMTFIAHSPDGKSETLLSIPAYHYGWQQNYRWEPGTKKFPKGTRIEAIAHFDNSPFNPFNPDPKATVRHGPQTVQEMMFGFFFYTDDDEDLKLKVDAKTGHVVK
ncbi:MAG: redoxin domain-containing protein [Pirellulaceae bacterium]